MTRPGTTRPGPLEALALRVDTVSRMGIRQILSRVARRLRHRWIYPRLGERLHPTPPPLDGEPSHAWPFGTWPYEASIDRPKDPPGRVDGWQRGRFEHLGLPAVELGDPLGDGSIDWQRAPGDNRLWSYELHYGQWALALARAAVADDGPRADGRRAALVALVDDWITHNPVGREPAWEPYPMSRRVVAWSRLAPAFVPEGFGGGAAYRRFWRERLEPSLRRQVRYLRTNLEHDVPNNHLVANYRALAWAGLLFDHWPESDALRNVGLRGLWRELDRQVLADGVHDERSTSYHTIVLLDFYETHALARRLGVEVPPGVAMALGRMLRVLEVVRSPAGHWPLLNDSVDGYPTAWARLDPTALRLDLALGDDESAVGGLEVQVFEFPRAGWAVWREPRGSLFFDAGPMGPDRILGHAHADTLGFELHWRGGPRIVDPGVVTYADGPWRDRLRGMAAHNTVTLDGQDPCRFWGPFRVAWPAHGQLLHADASYLEGQHDGYRRLPGGVVHRRRIVRQQRGTWEIHDQFIPRDGRTESGVEHGFASTLQWSPGATIEDETLGDASFRVTWPDGVVLAVTASDGLHVEHGEGHVSGGWHRQVAAPRSVFRWRSKVPCAVALRIDDTGRA